MLVEEGGLREVSSGYGVDPQASDWAGIVGVLILLTFAFLDFGMINVQRKDDYRTIMIMVLHLRLVSSNQYLHLSCHIPL